MDISIPLELRLRLKTLADRHGTTEIEEVLEAVRARLRAYATPSNVANSIALGGKKGRHDSNLRVTSSVPLTSIAGPI